jgi:hypothetical protein
MLPATEGDADSKALICMWNILYICFVYIVKPMLTFLLVHAGTLHPLPSYKSLLAKDHAAGGHPLVATRRSGSCLTLMVARGGYTSTITCFNHPD